MLEGKKEMLEEAKMFHSFKNSVLTLTTILLISSCSSVGLGPTEPPEKPVKVQPQTPDEAYNQANNCQSDYVRPDYDTLEKQLGTARARWKAQEPDNYTFNSSRGPDFPTTYSVSVEAKQVKYAQSLHPGAPPISSDLETYSVDQVFSRVAEDLKNRMGCFNYQLEFSERWGYPISLWRISHSKTVFHLLTYQYRVTNFHYQDLAYNATNRCTSSHGNPDWDALERNLSSAEALWKSRKPTNLYRYIYSSTGFRGPRNVSVQVNGSSVTASDSTGKVLSDENAKDYGPIENLFSSLRSSIVNRNSACLTASVEYDSSLGYPKTFSVADEKEGLQDAFGGFIISEFNVSPPTPQLINL